MDKAGTKQIRFDLSEPFITKIPYDVRNLVVDKYDGARQTLYIQFGRDLEDTREEIEHHKAWGWDEDKEIWLVNLSAQSGKELIISIGGPGTFIAAGTAYAGGYQSPIPNHPNLTHGQVTVGTTAVPLSASSVSVPDGFAVVVKYPAISTNTGTVYVGISGVTNADGFILVPGDSVELYVTDIATIYAIADTADQTVCYIVEQES